MSTPNVFGDSAPVDKRPFRTHRHQRNGLGARDHLGRMVCAVCGQPYDDTEDR